METDETFIKWWIIIMILVAIIILWLLNLIILVNNVDRGSYGDMFGVTNSLFSGLALAGIILTIWLQKNELSLQRQELIETRKEFHIQNKTLRQQRFENTFFQMLNLQQRIVNEMDIFQGSKRIIGRDVFRKHYSQDMKVRLSDCRTEEMITNVYNEYYSLFQTDFGHYFRNLYRIIKMIDQTDFELEKGEDDFETKYKYTSIARAQLSNYELIWLFYDGLSNYGKKFKPFIEKYTLLKNLPENEPGNLNHRSFYYKKAFEREK